MVTPVGSPPVSFLPRQEMRSHSRTILVSQLSLLDPLTPTSFVWAFHSSSVGTAERPFGPVAAGAVTAGVVTAGLTTAGVVCVAAGLGLTAAAAVCAGGLGGSLDGS